MVSRSLRKSVSGYIKGVTVVRRCSFLTLCRRLSRYIRNFDTFLKYIIFIDAPITPTTVIVNQLPYTYVLDNFSP